jgi:7-keto-8-aminopelargonate synthetase-like enzyme
MIGGKAYSIFNSNDIGLRHTESKKRGHRHPKTGNRPGAVRFISGYFDVHRQLKNDWQDFHGREDAIIIFTFAATWQ